MADISVIKVGTTDYTIKDAAGRALIAEKAPIASPSFSGTPLAPTPDINTDNTQIANTAWVNDRIDASMAAAQAMVYKGTIGTGSGNTWIAPARTGGGYYLPDTSDIADLKIGYTYIINTAGEYHEHDEGSSSYKYTCEIGDMVIKVNNNDHNYWTVVQKNIDGAVTGPSSSVDGRIAVFNGTTGKVIKDSGYTIAKSVPSTAVFTDTHVTAVGNHYTPTGTTTKSASGATGTSGTTVQVVTGITMDAAGHVTAITSGAATDTTYENKAAAAGGTAVSLVTTGDKYDWDKAYAHTDDDHLSTAQSSGLYKIATTSEGHIKSVTAVQKSDITALGIPSTNTTYSAGSGLSLSGTTFNHAATITTQTIAPSVITTTGTDKGKISWPTITVNGTGHATSVDSKKLKISLDCESIGDAQDHAAYVGYTPDGTVTQPTFSGTEKKFAFSGTAATLSSSYTPSGSITIGGSSGNSYTPAGSISVNASSGSGTSYTPQGSIGISATSSTGAASMTPSGSVSIDISESSDSGDEYTPSGTVSVTPTLSSTLTSVKTAGTLPTWSASVSGETLSFSFTQGAMPTFNTGNRASGITSASFSGDTRYFRGHFYGDTKYFTFTGTEKKLAFSGTASKFAFSGTAGTASTSYTPAGTININAASGSGTSYTPTGTVSQPTFNGSTEYICADLTFDT